jgi:hypothetical protein
MSGCPNGLKILSSIGICGYIGMTILENYRDFPRNWVMCRYLLPHARQGKFLALHGQMWIFYFPRAVRTMNPQHTAV